MSHFFAAFIPYLFNDIKLQQQAKIVEQIILGHHAHEPTSFS
jgi:hypothetical protein